MSRSKSGSDRKRRKTVSDQAKSQDSALAIPLDYETQSGAGLIYAAVRGAAGLLLDRVIKAVDPAAYRPSERNSLDAINQRRKLMGLRPMSPTFFAKIHQHAKDRRKLSVNESVDLYLPDDLREEIIENIVSNISHDVIIIRKMNNDENRNAVLKDLFSLASRLPTQELERLLASISKKSAKWEGIPTSAPELYSDRKASEELPDFLRRVYGSRDLLDGRLMTSHLDIIDRPLANAVRSYISHFGALPDDINIGTKFERSDRLPPRQ